MRKSKREKRVELIPFDKSRKIIRLEKRGRESKKISIGAILFGILGIICILYCIGIAMAGFGTYFFTIWGISGIACLILCGILNNRNLMEAIPKWIKILCSAFFIAGLLLFCGVEALIFTEYDAQAAPGADYCIVLGAQWKTTGPSEALRRRLDKAAAYLKDNPDTMVIVSGGQGNNEIISEAAGMRQYLIDAGIAEERILVEDNSSNTYENLKFSGAYLDRENDRVVIVTNNFHVFRALGIARKQGYNNAEGLAADSVLGMAPNNLLREFLGVIKDFLTGNL